MDVLVITSYPDQGKTHDEKTVGGASYMKLLLKEIMRLVPTANIAVFAERLTQKNEYEEEGVIVHRVWSRNNFVTIWQLFQQVRKNSTKNILVSFEAYMFGSPLYTGFFLLNLFLLKLTGKKIFFMMHQVVGDFHSIEKNYLKATILNIFRDILYFLVFQSSHKIIVFEEQLKRQLLAIDSSKVTVIPHFIDHAHKVDKITARQMLGLHQDTFYVLYFGFIAPYKGVDTLVDLWPQLPGINLILGGGTNPNYVHDPVHTKLFKQVTAEARAKNIITTDFIPEKDIYMYFCAADILILPYKTFLSSSGPLSLAFSYQLAVMLSAPLSGYFLGNDFKDALMQSNLTAQDLLFDFTTRSLQQRIEWAKLNMIKLHKFSTIMCGYRSIAHIANEYISLLQDH